MDLYLLALLLGFIGLAVMAISGFAGHGHGGDSAHAHLDAGGHLHADGGHAFGHATDHGGGHALASHGHGDVAHGHDVGHVHGGAHGHAGDAAHGHDAGQHDGHGHDGHGHTHGDHGADRSVGLMLLAWLSPRVLFGVLVGIGATGLLLRPHMPALLAAAVALAAGVLFEKQVLARVWGLLFRFESEPARTLVDAWMEVGTATTAFDAAGDGLVRIELNGELRQILGRLRPEDRQAGVRVHMGDRVRVEEVDPVRNVCLVSWLGPEDPAELASPERSDV